MKKIVSGLLIVIMLFSFGGCTSKKSAESLDLNKLFKVTATIESGKFKGQAVINRLGDNMWDVEFSSPNTLSGIKLSYSGEDITATYMGLSIKMSKTDAPIKGMLTMLFNAIDKSAALKDMPCVEDEKTKTFSGENENGKFNIILDKSTGNLIGFEMPDNDLKVTFTDYTLIQ